MTFVLYVHAIRHGANDVNAVAVWASRHRAELQSKIRVRARDVAAVKSSQVNTLPKAKSETRSKQNKDMHKYSSVYSERGVPLPVLTSGGE
jgi:hypothetical protein